MTGDRALERSVESLYAQKAQANGLPIEAETVLDARAHQSFSFGPLSHDVAGLEPGWQDRADSCAPAARCRLFGGAVGRKCKRLQSAVCGRKRSLPLMFRIDRPWGSQKY